jgi:hypothetical protein
VKCAPYRAANYTSLFLFQQARCISYTYVCPSIMCHDIRRRAQYGSDKGKHRLYPLKHCVKCCSEWLLHDVVVFRLPYIMRDKFIGCHRDSQRLCPHDKLQSQLIFRLTSIHISNTPPRIFFTRGKTHVDLGTGCSAHAFSNTYQIHSLYMIIL